MISSPVVAPTLASGSAGDRRLTLRQARAVIEHAHAQFACHGARPPVALADAVGGRPADVREAARALLDDAAPTGSFARFCRSDAGTAPAVAAVFRQAAQTATAGLRWGRQSGTDVSRAS